MRRSWGGEVSIGLSIVGLGTGTEVHLAGAEGSGWGGGKCEGRLEKWGQMVVARRVMVVFHGE